MKFRASNEQVDIATTLGEEMNKREKRDISVQSPAGSGKTSTVLYLMDCYSQHTKSVYLVFNLSMKKDIEQKLGYSNSYFKNINRDNVDVLTLNGYMRKVLTNKIKDIGFDYRNGSLTPEHLKTILDSWKKEYSTSSSSIDVSESFNKYTEQFLKGIEGLRDFVNNNEDMPYVNASIERDLSIILKNRGVDTETSEQKKVHQEVKKLFNDMLVSIFDDGVLNNNMPHSIYYKYVYEKYGGENLFEGYDVAYIDEAQDVDLIIIELLKKSNLQVVKLGDDFQQINRFRGTVNSMKDNSSISKQLTTSFRLSPYLALATTAYLDHQRKKLGINKDEGVFQIYGYSGNNKVQLENQKILESTAGQIMKESIDSISGTDVTKDPIYIELLSKKNKIDKSIIKGCSTKFKEAVRSFKKEKDYIKLLTSVRDYTSFFSEHEEGLFVQDDNSEYDVLLNKLKEESKNSVNFGDAQRFVSDIAKAYEFRFTKKDKIEILQNNNIAFLSRNNNKVLNNAYNYIKNIPYEPLGDFTLFNIRLSSTLSEKYESLIKGDYSSLSSRDRAMYFQGLDSLVFPIVSGENGEVKSLKEVVDALKSTYFKQKKDDDIETHKQIVNVFLNNPLKIESFLNIESFYIENKKYSLKQFGIQSGDVKDTLVRAVASAKRKLSIEEVTANDLVNNGYFKSLFDLIPIDKLLTENYTLDEVSATDNPFITNFYKYCEIKKMAALNDNIKLVADGAVSNVYFSTINRSKGLEFKDVFVSNDVYDETRELENQAEVDELFLAYVAITRAKGGKVCMEVGSSVIEQLDEVIEKGFSRHFKANEFIVEEHLGKNPSFSVTWLDSITKEEKREKIEFLNKSIYPSYKDIKILSNSYGDYKGISIFSDVNIDKDSKDRINFLKPIDERELYVVYDEWEMIQSSHKKEQVEIEKEALSVF